MSEITVNASAMDWKKADRYPAGAQWKLLRTDPEGRPGSALLKLEPGFEMDPHSHIYSEHHYVLEGEYESQGVRYPAGTYRMIPAHRDHGPFRSTAGALIFVVWVG